MARYTTPYMVKFGYTLSTTGTREKMENDVGKGDDYRWQVFRDFFRIRYDQV